MGAEDQQPDETQQKRFWDWTLIVLKHVWRGLVVGATYTYRFGKWVWRKIGKRGPEDEGEEPRPGKRKDDDDVVEVYGDEAIIVEGVEEVRPAPDRFAFADRLERESEGEGGPGARERDFGKLGPSPPAASEPERTPAPVPPNMDFEKAQTPVQDVEAVADAGAEEADLDRYADEYYDDEDDDVVEQLPPEPADEDEEDEIMTRETFVKIMSQTHEDLEDPDADDYAEGEEGEVEEDSSHSTSKFHESSVIDTEIRPLFELDKTVEVEALDEFQPGRFQAKVIHIDDTQVVFLRKETDLKRGATDIGDPIMVTLADVTRQTHHVRTQVSNSNGKGSPWFSVAVSLEAVRKGLPAGINLPIKFYIVFDARDTTDAVAMLSHKSDRLMHLDGMIRELDVNGMLLETDMELPEREFLVQDPRQPGILSRMELTGCVLSCSRDLQSEDKFLSTVQFEGLSPSAEQQIRALTGHGFLGNI